MEQPTVDQFEELTPAEQRQLLRALKRRTDLEFLAGLTERQQLMLRAVRSGRIDEILIGGAAGGGKTEFIARYAASEAYRTPGWHGLLLRQTLPQVKSTIQQRLIELFAGAPDPPTFRTMDRVWEFPNGSRLWIGFCKATEDAYQYLSTEFELIAADEATWLPENGLELLRTRLRTTKPMRPLLLLASNPGGPSHQAILDQFPIKPRPEDEKIGERAWIRNVDIPTPLGLRTLRRCFVAAKVQDNPYLSDSYIVRLSAAPDRMKRLYLEGDWDALQGEFFSEFDESLLVTGDFHPGSNRIRVGIDFGWSSPFAAIFIADIDGVAVVYDELYGEKIPPEQQAQLILNKLGGARAACYADPSAWNRSTGGLSVAHKWQTRGLPVQKARNDRVTGWRAVRAAFASGTLKIHERCTNLLNELQGAYTAENNPEDIDPRCTDHALDALRYAICSTSIAEVKERRATLSPIERDMARLGGVSWRY